MFEIKYTIKLTISKKYSGNVVDFSESFATSLNVPEELYYDNFHVIAQDHILNFLSAKVDDYLISNGLDRDDIEIESYEILSETPNVDIFFVNSDNPNEFTLTPTIKAYVHPLDANIEPPELHGEAVDSHTIKWSWETPVGSDYAHYLLDYDNNIVAQLPAGIDYYIETKLQGDTNYIRKLVRYNASGSSKPSVPLTVRTLYTSPSNELTKYEVLKKENYDKTPLPVISDRMPAIHSGIGDANDLLVFKQSESEFYEKFAAILQLYGVYTKRNKKYDQVGFNYRVKASGQYIAEEQDGYLKLKFHGYPIENVTFRVYKYCSKPVTIRARVKCKCEYYVLNPETLDMIPMVTDITSDTVTFTVESPITYTEGGYATLQPIDKQVSSQTILQMCQTVGQRHAGIAGSAQTPRYYAFSIEDDYFFDDGVPDKRWKQSTTRNFTTAGIGTIKTYATLNGNNYNPNSYLYVKGYAEAQLFHVEKFIDREMSFLEGANYPLLTSSDLNIGTPYNIADKSAVYNSGVITIVEVPFCESDLQLSSIKVNSNPVVSGTVTRQFHSPELIYDFSSEDPYAHIMYNRVLEGLNPDMEKEYHFHVDCTGVSPNGILYDGSINMTVGNKKIVHRSNCYKMLNFYSKLMDVIKTWEEVLPAPKDSDPMYGIVNGRFAPDNGFSGKQDLIVTMPTFIIPPGVYDVRYRVQIDSISPENAFVAANFEHQLEPGLGILNGDRITFSSDTITYREDEYKDLISTLRFEELELFDLKTKTFEFKIPKPTQGQETYIRYEMKAHSDNNDAAIIYYPETIEFLEDPQPIIIKAKGVQNATSRWSPRIHNGYYYVNQHEHFLFSEFNAPADYKLIEAYKDLEGFFTVSVHLKKDGGDVERYTLTRDDQAELLKYNALFKFDKGFIRPLPDINTKYYKEYLPVEYYSPTFIFPNVATAYSPVSFDTDVPSGTILQTYIRSYQFDLGAWSDWVPISSGEVPDVPLSAALQFKAYMVAKVDNVQLEVLETDCDYIDHKANIDTNLSRNVSIAADIIECTNDSLPGVYVSNIRDFGTQIAFNLKAFSTKGGTKLYLSGSNNKAALEENPIWTEVTTGYTMTGFRYYRYKIEIPAGGDVNLVYKTFNTPVSTVYEPGIGNFKVGATYIPPDKEYSFTKTFSFKIPFDGNWHVVLENVKTKIEPTVIEAGFTLDDIAELEVTPNSNNIELQYEMYNLPTNEATKMVDIFNAWQRFSHNYGGVYPANATEMMAWKYEAASDQVVCQVNSNTYIGFISDGLYDSYMHQLRISSADGDDDVIGTVIAFHKDETGKEHTLSAIRSTGTMNGGMSVEGKLAKWMIVYNYSQADQKLIADGNSTVGDAPPGGWTALTDGVTIKIERNHDTIVATTSQWTDTVLDPSTKLTVDLNSDPVLKVFKGPKQYGYSCMSQNKSTFKDIVFLNRGALTTKIEAKGKSIEIDMDKTPYIVFNDDTCVIHDLPQQFCPIIVQDNELGALEEVCFEDDKGNPTLVYTESFVSKRQRCFAIEHIEYDINTLSVEVDGSPVLLNSDYIIYNNVIEFKDFVEEGAVVMVSYKIKNSFIAILDISNNTTTIKVHTERPLTNTRVMFETNRADNKKNVKHLSLNPIYNTDYKGFIYISYDLYTPKRVDIYANPRRVKADAKDGINVHVQVLDEYGNPVSGEEMKVRCVIGKLDCKDYVTDTNGVVTMRYTAGFSKGTDTIVAECLSNGVKNSITIKNV